MTDSVVIVGRDGHVYSGTVDGGGSGGAGGGGGGSPGTTTVDRGSVSTGTVTSDPGNSASVDRGSTFDAGAQGPALSTDVFRTADSSSSPIGSGSPGHTDSTMSFFTSDHGTLGSYQSSGLVAGFDSDVYYAERSFAVGGDDSGMTLAKNDASNTDLLGQYLSANVYVPGDGLDVGATPTTLDSDPGVPTFVDPR